MKFKVGDKVIPISKSTGKPFKRFLEMEEGIEFKKRGYVTIKGMVYAEYAVDDKNNFLEKDLIPYTTSPEQAFEHLVKGRITEKEYTSMTRNTQ